MKIDITRITYRQDIETAPRRFLQLFLAMYIIYPMIFLGIIAFSIGFHVIGIIGLIVLLLCIPIIPSSTAAFLILNKKLKSYLTACKEDHLSLDREKFEVFMNRFPFRASLTIFVGFFSGTFLAILMTYLMKAAFSWQQALFLLMLGFVPAMIVTWTFYYYIKISLYPAVRIINYKPLRIFYKLYIPIISTLLMLLNITNLAIYKMIERNTIGSEAVIMNQTMGTTIKALDEFFGKVRVNTKNGARELSLSGCDEDTFKSFIGKMRERCDNDTTLFFVMNKACDVLARENDAIMISNEACRELSPGGKPVTRTISMGGVRYSVLIYPCDSEGGENFLGAATPMPTVIELVKRHAGAQRFLFVARSGLVVADSAGTLTGKTLGKDIQDNDSNQGINGLASSKAGAMKPVSLDGFEYAAFRETVSSLGDEMSLVLFKDKDQYYKATNEILLGLTMMFIVILFISSYIIREISRQIAEPVQETIEVFRRFSSGDLTVQTESYIPDEFGETTRHLKIVLEKISEIIRTISSMSENVHDAAMILGSISTRLSDNAREQASSVEETSASLEETLAALESIENNSRIQYDATSETYRSMENLKERIEEVSRNARDGLSMAEISSREAEKGNGLMANVITGMNNIETNTAQISEFVLLISDISDKVNLLALNASIEAARAGEHGRGFAVVADEIGKLADQTSEAAKSISVLVSQGQVEVQSGRNFVDTASRSLGTIIDNVKKSALLVKEIADSSVRQFQASQTVLGETMKIKEMSDSISKATSEQSIAYREIYLAIERINEAAQNIAEGSVNVASSSEDINSQSKKLTDMISFFRFK